MSRITAPAGEVTTPITSGMKGSFFLRASSKRPSAASFFALIQQLHQRAEARQLQPLDDELIFRLAGEGGEAAGRDDLQPLLRHEAEAGKVPFQITLARTAFSSFKST